MDAAIVSRARNNADGIAGRNKTNASSQLSNGNGAIVGGA